MKFLLKTLLFIVLIPLALEAIAYVSTGKNHKLFYEPINDIGFNPKLYSTLDPVLGFSFNPDYVPSENEKKVGVVAPGNEIIKGRDGFIRFEFLPNKSPLIIYIMGGSVVDSNLFYGSWPFQLHLILKEKNISHKIYNGAVLGYTSYQTFLKSLRDVSVVSNIDYLFFYDGLNDFDGSETFLKNYPSVNVNQVRLLDHLVGNFSKYQEYEYLPNLFYYINLNLMRNFKKDQFIQFGRNQLGPLDFYVHNKTILNEVFNHRVKYVFHFLQPLLQDKKQLDPASPIHFYYNEDRLKASQVFFHQVEKKMISQQNLINLQDFFNNDKEVFLDDRHLNVLGNEKVAKYIFNIMFEKNKSLIKN